MSGALDDREDPADARLFQELGRRFDAEDEAAPVPDATAARLVDAVLVDLRRKRPARWRWPWLLAAASLLLASLAGAVIAGRVLRSAAPHPSALPAVRSHRVTPTASPARAIVPSLPTPPATPSTKASAAEPRVSAAELFSAAGRARRGGQSRRAIELLETLQARYPSSPEASAGQITLGELELEHGASKSALGHFEAYLTRSPRGALAAEALWGRATALARLGNQTEAQESLRELLQRYPRSPYADAARAKLKSTGREH